jgi:hypothetical protein
MCAKRVDRSRPYTREQVVRKLAKFTRLGFINPDDLELDSPRVQRANDAIDEWAATIESHESVEADLEYALTRSTIYVDAGFHDRDYLDEVANDWLAQDEQTALQNGLTELAAKIRAKRDEINRINP